MDEYIFEMGYTLFIQKVFIVEKAVAYDTKNSFINGAFIAWLMGSGGELPFSEYVKQLGLVETEQLSQIQKTMLIQQEKKTALEIANKIREADKRRKV